MGTCLTFSSLLRLLYKHQLFTGLCDRLYHRLPRPSFPPWERVMLPCSVEKRLDVWFTKVNSQAMWSLPRKSFESDFVLDHPFFSPSAVVTSMFTVRGWTTMLQSKAQPIITGNITNQYSFPVKALRFLGIWALWHKLARVDWSRRNNTDALKG